MSTKQNLPNNPVTTANFTGEQGKMQELSAKYPRTTTGNLSYTSTTSGVVYNTATYDGGTYANQGEQGLFLVLQDALLSYIVFATDFNNKAETVDVGDKSSLTTTDKTNLVAAINEINAKGTNLQQAFLMTDKAVAELLMIADVDSKVFSPNLNKFYTNFSTVMDYSMGNIDATKQTYTGTLSAGATNVVLPSATGFSAGQEISIQDGTNYEDIIVSSVVSTTVSFKTALVNSYTNPIVYRSNNNGTSFGVISGSSVIDSDTKILLHMDGTSGAQTFPDSSPSAKSVTYAGNVNINTTTKKFGTGSAYFDGDCDYLSWPIDADVQFGSGSFTIDGWLNIDDISTTRCIYFYGNDGNTNDGIQISVYNDSGTKKMYYTIGTGVAPSSVIGTTPIPETTWLHFALVRNVNAVNLYFNGTSIASSTVTGSVGVPAQNPALSIGRLYGNNNPNTFPYKGYIDEFRISKGVARWTSNFTPPDSPYGSGTSTTKNVIRMNIAPYESVKYISAWLTKSELTGFTADGKVSIVASGADESYVDLTETVTDLGSTNEVQMLGSVTTPNPKVTLKVILNRASASDSVSFTKLLGGVSA